MIMNDFNATVRNLQNLRDEIKNDDPYESDWLVRRLDQILSKMIMYLNSDASIDHDEHENNLMATGAVHMALTSSNLDPQLITLEDGITVTNAISVKPNFMKSRYKITVERMPDTEEEDDHGA